MAEIDATLKIEETVALVAQWLDNTQRTETRNERRQSKRLSALIADPEGVAFTMDFVDRVARHRDNKAAANQLSRLARERKLPSFLNFFDKFQLFDLVYLALTILSLIKCSSKGFVLSVLSASKWLFSYVVTLYLFPKAKPFVGAEGLLLDKMLAAIGLSR